MAAEKQAFDYVNEIWSIADYVRDVVRPADYNKLILPFAVLRRFECALEPTRDKVLARKKAGIWDDADEKYCLLSGYCFYNLTSFRLGDLGAARTYDAQHGENQHRGQRRHIYGVPKTVVGTVRPFAHVYHFISFP